jgi:hypothetical protein
MYTFYAFKPVYTIKVDSNYDAQLRGTKIALIKTIIPRKLSAVDVLALATMKNAAKCDT